jgi:hypothetical protein
MVPSIIELCSVVMTEFTVLGACYTRRINMHHLRHAIYIFYYIMQYIIVLICAFASP